MTTPALLGAQPDGFEALTVRPTGQFTHLCWVLSQYCSGWPRGVGVDLDQLVVVNWHATGVGHPRGDFNGPAWVSSAYTHASRRAVN